MRPLISIIIPVYNVETYVEQCLNSVLEQNFQNYEVILVNDGSTDGSLPICEKIAQKDARIKIFSIDNGGVSRARNYGIGCASGRWIMFLDSDDYLLEDALQLLVDHITDSVQEICANYITNKMEVLAEGKQIVDARDVIDAMNDPINNQSLPSCYQLQSSTLSAVWGKLFLSEIIKREKILFDEKLKLSEDMFFHVCYLKAIQKVLLINNPVVYYRENTESASRKFKDTYVDDRIYLFELMERSEIHAPIYVVSTMMLLNCQVEDATVGEKRRYFEEKIKSFWKRNKGILVEVKGKQYSLGKFQNIIYKICVELFLKDLYNFAFLILRLYVKLK